MPLSLLRFHLLRLTVFIWRNRRLIHAKHSHSMLVQAFCFVQVKNVKSNLNVSCEIRNNFEIEPFKDKLIIVTLCVALGVDVILEDQIIFCFCCSQCNGKIPRLEYRIKLEAWLPRISLTFRFINLLLYFMSIALLHCCW